MPTPLAPPKPVELRLSVPARCPECGNMAKSYRKLSDGDWVCRKCGCSFRALA